MRIQSKYTKREYLAALKEQMGASTDFGCERFTGWFLGPLFSVTHHSGWEWNQRYSNVKNSAIGYVKETESGCEVRFLHTKGLLYPSGLIMIYGISFLLYLFWELQKYVGMTVQSPKMLDAGFFWFAAVLFLVVVLGEAFIESFTEDSQEGAESLLSCMKDPGNPYG